MTHRARPIGLAAVLLVALAATGAASASVHSTAPAASGSVGPAASATGGPTSQHDANVTEETTITVSAVGQVQADPDQAVVLLTSTATADDPANATARLAANVSQLRQALLAANLTREQFRTTDYNVFQQRDERPVPGPGNETVRYVAQQGFEVTLDDVNRTGEIIDLAVTSGATEVRGVSFTLSEESRRVLRQQALTEAVGDARRQAEAIASAANLTITGVGAVSSVRQDFIPAQARALEAAATADTQVDSGPVTVVASVQVTYVADETAAATVATGNVTAGNATAAYDSSPARA